MASAAEDKVFDRDGCIENATPDGVVDVVLEAAGDQKIQVIKEVRGITGLGLGEAKALVDAAPSTLLEGAKKEAAEDAKAKIEAAGGKVTLK